MSLRHGQTREVLAHKVPADALIAPLLEGGLPRSQQSTQRPSGSSRAMPSMKLPFPEHLLHS